MKIKNFEELATSEARRTMLQIAEAGLEAIDTGNVMRGMMRMEGGHILRLGDGVADGDRPLAFDLGLVRDIVFIAIGKCAAEASAVAEDVLGDRISRGVVVDVKVCPPSKTGRLQTFCGTHPLPSDENLRAAQAIVAALKDLSEDDLVIFVVSGGGSTLLFLPEDPASREETNIFDILTDAGATIEEINTVRKHTSYARGGYLAKDAYPARVVSLIISDVPGDDISFVASGPTVKDSSTVGDATAILSKYGVLRNCAIEKCGLIETPKDDGYFTRVTNILAASNGRALEAMRQRAESLGFRAEVRDARLTGEAEAVAGMVAFELHSAPGRSVLLWGGETTVAVHNGNGRGGRNLQLCLAALPSVADDEIILSLASDGRDHGAYAGALCDTATRKAIADAGLDAAAALVGDDSYPLFEKAGNYVMTGDTGSNVSDLIIALKT